MKANRCLYLRPELCEVKYSKYIPYEVTRLRASERLKTRDLKGIPSCQWHASKPSAFILRSMAVFDVELVDHASNVHRGAQHLSLTFGIPGVGGWMLGFPVPASPVA